MKERLENAIIDAFDELEDLNGEAREKKLKELKELYQLMQGDEKNECENDAQLRKISAEIEKNDLDRKLREDEIRENKKFRIIDTVLAGIGTVGSLSLYAIFTHKGFKFETDGIYSSKTFGMVMSKISNILKK